ncbi:M23 family metallopeptidase [Rhodococcoides kyotonense]|uniref:Murein DD-endopeptidase MepM and murein hydrolase activator NlpD, contain LysM domain n=1 Tax=Rhodococcoides kyotonense TaxID=398843 RepID=A0A239EH37_9NOCA|nr:M23 family metallopeptidase [Rhodococcus kyotonensis]SNS44060.1 Murein DD-endopeptidase MepM and murein hydrolase activator NlpD, contain LysM domain [Rhodococcus kyotonensis]
MSQHRASFTASRFVKPAAVTDSAPAVYSPETVYSQETVYSRETSWGSETEDLESTGYDYFASSYGSAESYHDSELHTVADVQIDTVTETIAAVPRKGGAHRIPTPPTALKGRAAVLAVAAGAVVAAGQAVVDHESTTPNTSEEVALAAGAAPAAPGIVATAAPEAAEYATDTTETSPSSAPQILNVANPVDLSQFNDLLAKGQRFSEERAAREAAARRPLFVLPAVGTYTSNFGTRWGVLHAGVDIANSIGTPILAVADGKVIDAGPASGFGMWVRLQHADGTITVYGHIDSANVTVGQEVMAGDQIARMGNRGFSTGPHLHFEVHLPGEAKIDPLPWLASRGISLGPEQD